MLQRLLNPQVATARRDANGRTRSLGINAAISNVAEIELSALARQCLDRRIRHAETLEREVTAWVADRHAAATTID